MGRWRGENVERACAKAKRAQEARKKHDLGKWLEAVTRPPGRWAGNALIIHDSIVVEYSPPSAQELRRRLEEQLNKFLVQYDQDAGPDEIASFLDTTDHHSINAWSGGSNLPARRP